MARDWGEPWMWPSIFIYYTYSLFMNSSLSFLFFALFSTELNNSIVQLDFFLCLKIHYFVNTDSIFIGLKHMHIHVHLYDSFMLTCIYMYLIKYLLKNYSLLTLSWICCKTLSKKFRNARSGHTKYLQWLQQVGSVGYQLNVDQILFK